MSVSMIMSGNAARYAAQIQELVRLAAVRRAERETAGETQNAAPVSRGEADAPPTLQRALRPLIDIYV